MPAATVNRPVTVLRVEPRCNGEQLIVLLL